MPFVKADRTKTFARIALTGPTNSGKTISAIRIAQGIVRKNLSLKKIKATQDDIDSRIAIIDTERGRAKFYADRTEEAYSTGRFLHAKFDAPYSIQRYIELVEEAASVVGEEGVIIVDSLSHAWAYAGGLLEVKTDMETKRGVNSFTAWNQAGQLQNKLVDRILSVNAHLISTLRSKMNYVMEMDDKGNTKIKQVGLKPIQRDDLEYEFDVTLMLDKETHHATIIKDTTFLSIKTQPDGTIGMLNEKFGEDLIAWLEEGADPTEMAEEERLQNIEIIQNLCRGNNELKMYYKEKLFPNKAAKDLTLNETRKTLNKLYQIAQLYEMEEPS